VNLDQMQRGRNEFMRKLHFEARDKPEDALDILFSKGNVTAEAEEGARLQVIAQKYMAIDQADRKDALVITGTNAERIKINEAIRSGLGLHGGTEIKSIEISDATGEQAKMLANYEAGDLIRINQAHKDWKANSMFNVVEKRPESLLVKDASGREHVLHPKEFECSVSIASVEEITVAVGDRVRLTANDKSKDKNYFNGDKAEVTKIEEGRVFARLDRTQEEISFEYEDANIPLRYSYAQTGHSAQGATAKLSREENSANVILCMKAGDGTIDRKSFYTNMTRAADKLEIVTDAVTAKQIEDLRMRISRSNDKLSTEDLLTKDVEKTPVVRAGYIAPAKGDKAWQRIEIPEDASRVQLREILDMAREQYGDEFFVSGSKNERMSIATIAGKAELPVKFDDAEMTKLQEHHVIRAEEKRIELQRAQEAMRQAELERQREEDKEREDEPEWGS